jgi:lysophospholipase L1-like esterase
MNLANFLYHYGFKKPYQFNRVLNAIIACLLLAIVSVWCIYLYKAENLHAHTLRLYFFIYLFIVLSFALLLVPWQRTSMVLLFVGSVELLLGLMTHVGTNAGLIGVDLLPQDVPIAVDDRRFKYHSALGVVPRENFKSSSGLDIRHNSLNMRGAEISLKPGQTLISVYGGSTTYDIAVSNGETWPEALGRQLGDGYVVANFGVPGYSSSEHITQTAFYSDLLGQFPDCAVYYIGWNDIRNAHLPKLDAAYADFHLLSQFTNLKVRTTRTGFSPLSSLAMQYLAGMYDSFIPYPPAYLRMAPEEDTDPRLEFIFRKNIKTLTTINRSRDVPTIFIGQILNRERLTSNDRYGWLPRVKDKDVWRLQEKFNEILQTEAMQIGAHYIAVDIERFQDSDFVDNGHFSVQGAKKFSDLIAQQIKQFCKKY